MRRLCRRNLRFVAPLTLALLGSAAALGADAPDRDAPVLGDELGGAATLLVLPTVNGARHDVALLVRDGDGRYYADDATLADWRIAPPFPAPIELAGRELHALDAIPGLGMEIAERSMTAAVNVPPELMIGTRRSLGQPRGAVVPEAALGAYLDYDVAFTDDAGAFDRGLSGLLSPTLFTRRGSLSASALYAGGVSPVSASSRPWVRLETAWAHDDVENMRTLRVGDAITPYGSWAHAVRIGGVQFGTNFATRPDKVTFPQPSLDGTAAVPSALDILVNGTLRSSTDVPSGAFHLDEIPVVTGAGQIQVVTRDLLGREQVLTQDFYVSDRLLKRGLNEYSVSAGAVRKNFGVASNSYGDLLATGVLRRGISDVLTIEGRIDATAAELAAGVSVARAIGRYGVTTAALALSDGARGGVLWQVGHEFQGRVYRANLRVQRSRDFVQPGLDALVALPRSQIIASGGRNFASKGSLGLSYVDERFARPDDDRRIVMLSYSRSLTRRLVLWTTASYIASGRTTTGATVAVTRVLRPRSSVSSLASLQRDASSVRVDQRYELPAGPGFGYRTSVAAGEVQGADIELAANTEHAHYSAEASQRDGAHGWRVQTRGSLAALGGELFAAREISDGFAVVDAGGFEGVHVYLENREIGTTNGRGHLLVPSLRPYESNQLRIESADLPLAVRIDNPALRVAPYYRSGAIASFGISATASGILRVVAPDGTPLPEGAKARVDGGAISFPVGLDGRLYVQHVRAGAELEVAYGEARCAFTLGAVPPAGDGVPDLGDVVCRPTAAAPGPEKSGAPASTPRPDDEPSLAPPDRAEP